MARPLSIAVTGATGWIGGRLCARAAERGFAIRPIPRAALGSTPACAQALAGCDVVVHLAAAVHRRPARVPEQEYAEVNERLTARLAEAARRASVGRFLFVSTAKVMGERTLTPVRESDPPRPADGYARSKLAAERLLASTLAGTKVEVVVARPALVYGPGVRANFLALLRAADTGWPLPLEGAQARRSMVFVENLVDAILFLCESPRAAGRTFFVADDAAPTVAQLVRALRLKLGRPPRMFTVPRKLLDIAARAAALLGADLPAIVERLFEPLEVDTGALRGLGWQAPFGQQRALDETIRWHREGEIPAAAPDRPAASRD